MAGVHKAEEIETYRGTLARLRARLRGDLDQMTEEALKRNQPEASGNLSNMPLHMADVGTESYDQEFTLGLIENEQTIIEQIDEALGRIAQGTFGKCLGCGTMIPRPRLQALPYARHCIDCARKQESARS
jgi:RNA polymerase-binding protein DksA